MIWPTTCFDNITLLEVFYHTHSEILTKSSLDTATQQYFFVTDNLSSSWHLSLWTDSYVIRNGGM